MCKVGFLIKENFQVKISNSYKSSCNRLEGGIEDPNLKK